MLNNGGDHPAVTGDCPLVYARLRRSGALDCYPASNSNRLYVLAENHQKSKRRLTQRDAGKYGQDGDLCTPYTRAGREAY